MPETFLAKDRQNYFGISGNLRANLRQRRRLDGTAFKPLLEEFAQAPAEGDMGNFLIPAQSDLTYKIDFRQIYATVLGQKFAELPFLG